MCHVTSSRTGFNSYAREMGHCRRTRFTISSGRSFHWIPSIDVSPIVSDTLASRNVRRKLQTTKELWIRPLEFADGLLHGFPLVQMQTERDEVLGLAFPQHGGVLRISRSAVKGVNVASEISLGWVNRGNERP